MSDGKQCVKINKTIFDQQLITQGVPQGSISGPLFFLLFVNDLPLQDSLEGLNLFADDAAGSAHGINVEVLNVNSRLYQILLTVGVVLITWS